jgi:transcriptional/translational regulatory protein YebC/TACO1
MVLKAKAAQMTNDAIDRAIKRGSARPGAAPTSRSRTRDTRRAASACSSTRSPTTGTARAPTCGNIFSKLGGSMAEPGAVSWQFSRKGVVLVSGPEDEVMMVALDAGADDVADDGGTWRVTCSPSAVYDVRDALEAAGLEVVSAESTMVSSTTIEVSDPDDAKKVLRIIDALEDNDDVQDVFGNFDISDDLMEAVG